MCPTFIIISTYCTRVGASLSSLANLLSDVVQGSSIGPVAFFIFLDGLAKLLESHNLKSKIFADDVKAYLSIENDMALLYYNIPWI